MFSMGFYHQSIHRWVQPQIKVRPCWFFLIGLVALKCWYPIKQLRVYKSGVDNMFVSCRFGIICPFFFLQFSTVQMEIPNDIFRLGMEESVKNTVRNILSGFHAVMVRWFFHFGKSQVLDHLVIWCYSHRHHVQSPSFWALSGGRRRWFVPQRKTGTVQGIQEEIGCSQWASMSPDGFHADKTRDSWWIFRQPNSGTVNKNRNCSQ